MKKDGKRWLEMVAYHKAMSDDLETDGEKYYYFYMRGLEHDEGDYS